MNGMGPIGLLCLVGMLISCSSPGGSISTDDSGNVCESDQDCGEGRCVTGHCKARESFVRRLLVEVKPLVSANSVSMATSAISSNTKPTQAASATSSLT